MSFQSRTYKAEIFVPKKDERYVELRQLAAKKLNTFRNHVAGHGTEYVYLGGELETKIRFSDHENTSRLHDEPDINIVGRNKLTPEELQELEEEVNYPRLCKKTAFAKHCGLTIQRLKKLLTAECYEKVCEDPIYYPKTHTEFVIVEQAFKILEQQGITERHPVAQETWTAEDYTGG